jgi:vitamin B12 transporter
VFNPSVPSAHRAGRVALLLLSAATPAFADDRAAPPLQLDPVVVSATRIPTPREQLGSSVSVITRDEIERRQARTLSEILQDVPGVYVSQSGGPGSTSSISLRGTNPNHTKIFIDGIDVSDPSAPNGMFDFSQILAADIERVEVLRGPQSGLYGSDAIGGVVNIITRRGSGPPQFRGQIEGGSFATFNQSVGASGSISRFNYDLNFAHYHTGNTPVTPPDLVPAGRPINPDYYDNKSYTARVGAGLTDNFDVGVVTRYTDTFLQSTSDDFLGPEPLRTRSSNQELFTRGTAHLVLFGGRFEQTAGIAYTNYHRDILDPNNMPPLPTIYRGDRVKLDWVGNITVMPGQIVTLGAERQRDAIDDSTPVQAQMTNHAGFAQLQSSFGDRLFNTISLRHDSYDRFGGRTTYREAPAVLFPETGTKLKASVGTGFKAPSLDQLFQSFPAFGFFANPNLKPETSLGYDAGFEQTFLDRRIEFGGTYFHNDIKNLITINDNFTTLVNVGQATTYGAETFAAFRPWETLTLRANYTYTIAKDEVLDTELLRRPKHKASLEAAWKPNDAATLSATLLYVGPWADISRSGAVTGLRSGGYTLVNLAGSYDLGHGITAFARINNLLDRRYQEPIGFLHQGLGVFGGIRVAFDASETPR